jgi:hypothetical protein
MTSVLASYRQIPARNKFFVVVVAGGGSQSANPSDWQAFMDSSSNGIPTSLDRVVTDAQLSPYVDLLVLSQNSLLKDLGREIHIYDDALADATLTSNWTKLAIFRNVQLQNGATSEGASGDDADSFWVKVWSADGTGVIVARTG